MLERAIADYQRLGGASEPAFFDRGIPDMVGYAEVFALDAFAPLAASRRYRYDEVVFVLPAWPEIYVTDGDRRMTFESARAFGERVREVYLDLGYTSSTCRAIRRSRARGSSQTVSGTHDVRPERGIGQTTWRTQNLQPVGPCRLLSGRAAHVRAPNCRDVSTGCVLRPAAAHRQLDASFASGQHIPLILRSAN